jgi:hypothetical protein
MLFRVTVIAMFAGACGNVTGAPGSDAASSDGAAQSRPTTTYAVQVDMIPPVMFGGAPQCTYTITLKQLDVELAISASGDVVSGQIQDLNVEDVLDVPPCTPQTGHIDPNIVAYTFTSAQPSATGTMLSFQGAAANKPNATLVAILSSTGSAYSAALMFHRIDGIPAVNWTVSTTVTLSAR